MRQLKISPIITSRDANSLSKYLNDISKIELLMPEEEILLAQKIKTGDHAAWERLVVSNLRFVVSVAKRYQRMGLSLGDLINEGNLGLLKAAWRFDETKGFKFISFAVWWIRQTITAAIAEQTRTVRLPLNQVSAISKINKAISQLEQELERNPTAEEISALIEVDQRRIESYLGYAKLPVSLDAIVDDEIGSSLLDVLVNDHHETDYLLIRKSDRDNIYRILNSMFPRDKEILILFFGLENMEPMELEDIAVIFKLTKERIRQLKEKALIEFRRKARLYFKGLLDIN